MKIGRRDLFEKIGKGLASFSLLGSNIQSSTLNNYVTCKLGLTRPDLYFPVSSAVISNLPQLGIIKENIVELYSNSEDTSIINSNFVDFNHEFGVSIYVDPAGIYPNLNEIRETS